MPDMNLITNMIPQVGIGSSEGENLENPSFTYTNGKLTTITYDNGATKTLSYTGSQLTSVVFTNGITTTTKTLTYNADGTLSSITQS